MSQLTLRSRDCFVSLPVPENRDLILRAEHIAVLRFNLIYTRNSISPNALSAAIKPAAFTVTALICIPKSSIPLNVYCNSICLAYAFISADSRYSFVTLSSNVLIYYLSDIPALPV